VNLSLKRLTLGKSGEQIASRFLRKKGYRILEMNYRTSRGEIDIIARNGQVLIFTEVKTRNSDFLESPLAAVTIKKQRQISMVAQEYLTINDLFDSEARFDVIAIELREGRQPHIEHIENAFDLSYGC
jgi:putative endonuclease